MPTPLLPPFLLEEAKAPALNDERWAGWSRPVLEFLSEPRTWVQLHEWSAAEKMNDFRLRHCLAYLEEMGLARTYGRRAELRWVTSDYRGKQILVDKPRESPTEEDDEDDAETPPQSEPSSSDPTGDSQTET